jgi:hypothetical protein
VTGNLGGASAPGCSGGTYQYTERVRLAASGDTFSQALWRTALAKVLARRGEAERAEALAREAVDLLPPDLLMMRSDAAPRPRHRPRDKRSFGGGEGSRRRSSAAQSSEGQPSCAREHAPTPGSPLVVGATATPPTNLPLFCRECAEPEFRR